MTKFATDRSNEIELVANELTQVKDTDADYERSRKITKVANDLRLLAFHSMADELLRHQQEEIWVPVVDKLVERFNHRQLSHAELVRHLKQL